MKGILILFSLILVFILGLILIANIFPLFISNNILIIIIIVIYFIGGTYALIRFARKNSLENRINDAIYKEDPMKSSDLVAISENRRQMELEMKEHKKRITKKNKRSEGR